MPSARYSKLELKVYLELTIALDSKTLKRFSRIRLAFEAAGTFAANPLREAENFIDRLTNPPMTDRPQRRHIV